MQVMEARRRGGPAELVPARRERPRPGPGQVLVRVRALGINPVDWKLCRGALGPFFRARFPFVPGCEAAGEVVEAGPGATRFAVGAAVTGFSDPRAGGAAAEFALFDEASLLPRPPGWDDVQAAGLPVAGLTAWQALYHDGRLAAGERVLVVGAGGGVGHVAVQVARAAGAHVTALAGPAGLALAREMGAHELVDRTTVDPCALSGFDLVLDAVASRSAWRCRGWMKAGGRYVSTLPTRGALLGVVFGALYRRRTRIVLLKARPGDLDGLTALAASGALRVVVDEVFPLADLAAAHARSATGRVHGKLVVTVP